MSPLWKPQNGFHSGLEISLENARFPQCHRRPSWSYDEEPTEDWTDSTQSGTFTAPADERNSGGKGFENPGSIPSENRQWRPPLLWGFRSQSPDSIDPAPLRRIYCACGPSSIDAPRIAPENDPFEEFEDLRHMGAFTFRWRSSS